MTEEQGTPTPFTPYFKQASGPGAEWVVWNNIEDPLIVTDTLEEIDAGRNGLVLLDNSGLQKLHVSGPDAGKFLDYLCIRPLSNMKEGRVAYVVLADENGNIRDDGTAFRLFDGSYIVATGTNLDDWADKYKGSYDVTLADASTDWCMLAVYGPKCYSMLAQAGIEGLESLKAFQFLEATVNGVTFNVSRTGFSGALGYEIWAPSSAGAKAIETLLDTELGKSAKFVGLSSLDVLRIEAGYIVPGVDFPLPTVDDSDPTRFRTPYDMGLDWMVKLDRDDFVGKSALQAEKENGSKYQFLATVLDDTSDLGLASLYGAAVTNAAGENIGEVVAGGYSPNMKQNIGLCIIQRGKATVGDSILVGDDKKAAKLHQAPLYTSACRTQTPPPAND